MNWKRLLAYITGSVDQELPLRNEYLVTENRILRSQLKGRLQLNDSDRMSLAEIGKPLSRRALDEVAQIVRPETILAWHRRLVAKKSSGSRTGAEDFLAGIYPNPHRGPGCGGFLGEAA